MSEADVTWFDDYAAEGDDVVIDEYDISAIPNDFNCMTLFHFVESGAVRIPGFQRNYVWDLPRASKLIESLILGIPVPQIFLYEQGKNTFLVIDGQQRLMSIYYFIKRRFPRKDKRGALRSIFDKEGKIPEDVLFDDEYFSDFRLRLKTGLPGAVNQFHGLNHSQLGDHKTQFELRPLRNIIVKQNVPAEDDSSMYEVFNRLNTGGMNLTAQEIRTSMYHSRYYDMLQRMNVDPRWRRILQSEEPDLHAKDIEILLRACAMLLEGAAYKPSMIRFLNVFSRKCQRLTEDDLKYTESLISSFLDACSELPENTFINERNNRFNIALLEAVFTATCSSAAVEKRPVAGKVSAEQVAQLEGDKEFVAAAVEGSTHTANVEARLKRANSLIKAL